MSEGGSVPMSEEERIRCLVQQGFTPSLARGALLSRSPQSIPLTIWIVDNSSSMLEADGKRLLETPSHHDVRIVQCTRWEELKETIYYHGQLAALLEAPTKFILLNRPMSNSCPQELSIAERGPAFIQDDLNEFFRSLRPVEPQGVTPLTRHLQNIYHSIQHLESKIVLVIATDGMPTDPFGYSSPTINRDFEHALRQLQSKAWVVIRLCTNDDHVLQYYQNLDCQLELSLEVLDDYFDEAKEVNQFNPWLTYSLCLHRCREMGMSCQPLYRWLDLLDERQLRSSEIAEALQLLGVVEIHDSREIPATTECEDWKKFCKLAERQQKPLLSMTQQEGGGKASNSCYLPWNPMQKRPTPWIDIRKLERHGQKKEYGNWIIYLIVVFAIVLYRWSGVQQ